MQRIWRSPRHFPTVEVSARLPYLLWTECDLIGISALHTASQQSQINCVSEYLCLSVSLLLFAHQRICAPMRAYLFLAASDNRVCSPNSHLSLKCPSVIRRRSFQPPQLVAPIVAGASNVNPHLLMVTSSGDSRDVICKQTSRDKTPLTGTFRLSWDATSRHNDMHVESLRSNSTRYRDDMTWPSMP